MFSRGEEQRSGQVLDVLTDETNGLRIAVSRFGAELVSIQKRDDAGNWTGFLYRDNDLTAPASGWALNHATVMRLLSPSTKKDGHSFYRGHEIKGGNHSFPSGTKTWHAIDSADDQLKYRITPADFSATDYPLRVSLELTYQLDNGQLIVRFEFTNDEPELVADIEFRIASRIRCEVVRVISI